MGFQVDNNYSKFYESNTYQFQDQPTANQNNIQPSADFLAKFFDFLSKAFASNGSSNNTATDNFLNNLFQGTNQQPKVEDYGGFQFKSEAEKAKVDQALQELRAQQAANPGQPVSKKFKIGKYKYNVSLDANGNVEIKKKKKKGFFSKLGSAIGGAFKKVGGFLKKALPIISTVAMFIPGLQPLALAGRIASGVMGVVDGIKNGNIFGAVMSGVGALSGVGGKVGSFFSNLSSKASGFLGNLGTSFMDKLGSTGGFLQNLVGKGTDLLGTAKNWFTNFTGSMGNKVSDFIFNNGSNLLGDLSKTFGGKVGDWLTQNGPSLLKNFASSMGQRATNWLTDKANGLMARLMNNPIARKVNDFINSPFGQILVNMFRGNRA